MRPGRAPAKIDADWARELMVAEYRRMSDEIYHSYEAAQGIVRFALAAYGAIFTAGLLASRSNATPAAEFDHFTQFAVFVVFGLALPALMCVACWTWIGELNRAERAGAYVFELERRVAADPRLSTALAGSPPIGWESHLRVESRHRSLARKRTTPYLGTAALFAGGAVASYCCSMLWWAKVWDWETRPPGAIWWIVGPSALLVLFFATSLRMGRQVMEYARASHHPG
ncbi:hypothetical protein [Cellulomonas edaphi]|uniref:Uncharacterized protein n=1 Tax=Cellulomonas edaphi TaxID=3053468 RepID=A0ABT7S789_9CELL|nr:hypothetical protein [Cellulomons edaphi]MDM7831482.1 hypothetical protein [Cellulomons edaphi]